MYIQSYFSNEIEPSCSYCRFGFPTVGRERILCEKCGVVSPDFACRKFAYCALKRIPKAAPNLPSYAKEDFEI